MFVKAFHNNLGGCFDLRKLEMGLSDLHKVTRNILVAQLGSKQVLELFSISCLANKPLHLLR